ncbi:DUF4372 domain-containing protein [Desulfatiferula olefinivorans]
MGKSLILTKNKNHKRRIKRMVRHSGIFSQVVSLINRNVFKRLVKAYSAERYSKGFNSWDHLLLDHDGYLPTYALITNGKKHDVIYLIRQQLCGFI